MSGLRRHWETLNLCSRGFHPFPLAVLVVGFWRGQGRGRLVLVMWVLYPRSRLLALCVPSFWVRKEHRRARKVLINNEILPWLKWEVVTISHHQRACPLLQKPKLPIALWDQTGCIRQVKPSTPRSFLPSFPSISVFPKSLQKTLERPSLVFSKERATKATPGFYLRINASCDPSL